jgi:hypothetical protein
MVRCKDGLPTELVTSFLLSVRDAEQGLRARKYLFERVLLNTDQSIAALQAYFDIRPKQPSLHVGLITLTNVLEELTAVGCKPWDPPKRISLEKVYITYEPLRRERGRG